MESVIDLDNLEYHEKIGTGASGTVYLVTFTLPYKGYTEAAAKRVTDEFRKEEVEILEKLSHPNIVDLIGFYQDGPFNNVILLEYAKLGSLHGYLSDNSKPLPDELKRKWIRESALGIKYLHANNCLHRDIKAQNCLLFDDNKLKLCDFGLARETDHSITMSSYKGTYQYMAPELLNAKDDTHVPYSKFADIYAYGMLTFNISTRRPPFEGEEFPYVVFNVGRGNLQPTIPLDCPEGLGNMMKSCWQLNSRSRPTIDVILQMLEGTLTILQPSPTSSGATGLYRLPEAYLQNRFEMPTNLDTHLRLARSPEERMANTLEVISMLQLPMKKL